MEKSGEAQVQAQIDLLLRKRSIALTAITNLRTEIEVVSLKDHFAEEDKRQYAQERGGDINYIKLTEDELKLIGKLNKKTDVAKNKSRSLAANTKVAKTDMGAVDSRSIEQVNRRFERAERNKKNKGPKLKLSDPEAFSELRANKPRDDNNFGSTLNEEAARDVWKALPQDEDRLCCLDVDTIEDIFESVGIVLTDAEAQLCLKRMPTNQLGKYSFGDVISYCRKFASMGTPDALPAWRKIALRIYDSYVHTSRLITDILNKSAIQRKLVDDLLVIDGKYNATSNFKIEKTAEQNTRNNITDSTSNLLGEMQGSVRLAAWQKQQLSSPPSLLSIKSFFGRVISNSPKDSRTTSTGEAKSLLEKMREVAAAEVADANKWRLRVDLRMGTTPTAGASVVDSKRSPLSLGSNRVQGHVKDILPGHILENYKYVVQGKYQDSEKQYETVFWFVVKTSSKSTFEEKCLLMSALRNFFEAVSWDCRKDLYEEVRTELLFNAEAEDEAEDESEDEGGGGGEEDEEEEEEDEEGGEDEDSVILVSLLRSLDLYREVEAKLPVGLLVTRSVRKFDFQFKATQTLSELYKASKPFEHLSDRLFGPQEDELGDEGMNPLRFAKMCRDRKNAATAAAEGAHSMGLEEMRRRLKENGLFSGGTQYEMAERIKAHYKRQAEIIGFGELSAFGADMIAEIFSRFAEGKDMTMPLWNINKFLDFMDSQTLYSEGEYKEMLRLQNFLSVDGKLSMPGLVAYYEKYGRLAQDMQRLQIGSLSDQLVGEGSLSVEFEAEGVLSLLDLLESRTTQSSLLKYVIAYVSSIDKVKIDTRFDNICQALQRLADVINPQHSDHYSKSHLIQQLIDVCKGSGTVAKAVNRVLEFLADGEEGVLRSLRLNIQNEFGKYTEWESIFAEKLPILKRALAKSESSKSSESKDAGTSFQQQYKVRVDETVASIAKMILPSVSDSKRFNPVVLSEIERKLNRIVKLLGKDTDVRLTLLQRETLMKLKSKLEQQYLQCSKQIKESEGAFMLHSIALYDAMRLYGSGIISVGFGTKELSANLSLEGLDFCHFMPLGIGERCKVKASQEEKQARSQARKHAAIEAMDRAKKQMTTDPKELEELRVQRAEELKQKHAEEEAKLYGEAFRALLNSREERKSIQEKLNILTLFERLCVLKNNRYPKTIQSAICENNFACVAIETMGIEHPRANDAVNLFERANATMVAMLREHAPFCDHEAVAAATTVPMDVASIAALVLQNYVSYLRLTKNDRYERISPEKVCYVTDIHDLLSQKDQTLLKSGKSRLYENVTTLCIGSTKAFKEELDVTFDECAKLRAINNVEEIPALAVETVSGLGLGTMPPDEAPAASEESKTEQAAQPSSDVMLDENGNPMTEAQIKKAKFDRQRMEDAVRRMNVSRERMKMYALIQSNQISQIFAAKAGGQKYSTESVDWGGSSHGDGDTASHDIFGSSTGGGLEAGNSSILSYDNYAGSTEGGTLVQSTKHGGLDDYGSPISEKKGKRGKGLGSAGDFEEDKGVDKPPPIPSYLSKKVAKQQGIRGLLDWVRDVIEELAP